jgi:hypothetical protein
LKLPSPSFYYFESEIMKTEERDWIIEGLKARIARKRTEIKELESQLLTYQQAAAPARGKKKRGRPRKNAPKVLQKSGKGWTPERRKKFEDAQAKKLEEQAMAATKIIADPPAGTP